MLLPLNELADATSHVLATEMTPSLPVPLPPACPQRHARDIDERRNRLSQEQLAARNQALHRTMQASRGSLSLLGLESSWRIRACKQLCARPRQFPGKPASPCAFALGELLPASRWCTPPHSRFCYPLCLLPPLPAAPTTIQHAPLPACCPPCSLPPLLTALPAHCPPCPQVLLHASECTDPKCPSSSCARVKAMYHHAMNCPVKLAGNCQYCR